MIVGIILANIMLLVIFGFLLFCVFFRWQDAKFSLLNLFRHKRRSFSTAIAIIVGGLTIFLYGGFIDYSFWILKEQTVRTNLGHIQIFNKNYFESSNKTKSIIQDYDALKKDILHNPELNGYISSISGQLEFTGVISQYESETTSYFSSLGIEPLAAIKLGAFDKRISGSDLSRIKTDEVMLGSGLANTLNANYSDWLDVLVVNAQGGQGALSLKLRGIFSSGIKDYDDIALKMPLKTAQHIMNTNGVSKVVILLKDDANLELFSKKLNKFIDERQLPLFSKSWKELSLYYQQVEGLLSGIYFFIKVIVILIAIFTITNTMTMNILERTREITTLRALGLRPTHVTRLFLLEGIYIGIIGAVGSLILGFTIAAIISLQGIPMPPSPGQTQGYNAFIKTDSAELIWITVFLPVLTAALASVLPARRASRLNISDAFKSV